MRFLRPFLVAFAFVLACAGSAGSPSMLAGAALTGCTHQVVPTPPLTDGGAVAPTGTWTEQSHALLDLLDGSPGTDTRPATPGGIDLTLTVLEIWPMADVNLRQRILGDIRAVRPLTSDLRAALTAFERGDQGGRCRASAALRAIGIALRGVALSVARVFHWDVADQIRFAIGLASSLADQLNPSCTPDAGWSHLGQDTQAAMAGRASPLRAFPSVAEARRMADAGR